ncbi:MAG: hypothetical protein AB1768_17025 [Pseudomonadota bacterium]|jgi:hypothetical protein
MQKASDETPAKGGLYASGPGIARKVWRDELQRRKMLLERLITELETGA